MTLSGGPGTQPPATSSEAGSSRGDECDTIVTAPASRRPERSIVRGISTFSASTASAPGRTRTGNLRIRRPMLYPLSYGGVRKRSISLRHLLLGVHPRRRSHQRRLQHLPTITTESHSHYKSRSNLPYRRFSGAITIHRRTNHHPPRNSTVIALQPLRDRASNTPEQVPPRTERFHVSNITTGSTHS